MTDQKPQETHDFGDGQGPVAAHRHRNPDGRLGGWVAETAYVAPTAYLGPDAKVYGIAQVFGKARIYGNAQVFGNALVSGDAQVSGNARVCGNAHVSGNALVFDQARVSDSARVSDNAHLSDNARVYGNAQVSSNARLLQGGYTESPLVVQVGRWTATLQAPLEGQTEEQRLLCIGCQHHPLATWRWPEFQERMRQEHEATEHEMRVLVCLLEMISSLQRRSKEPGHAAV